MRKIIERYEEMKKNIGNLRDKAENMGQKQMMVEIVRLERTN